MAAKREPWFLIPESAITEIKLNADKSLRELRSMDSDYADNILDYIDNLLTALDKAIECDVIPRGVD